MHASHHFVCAYGRRTASKWESEWTTETDKRTELKSNKSKKQFAMKTDFLSVSLFFFFVACRWFVLCTEFFSVKPCMQINLMQTHIYSEKVVIVAVVVAAFFFWWSGKFFHTILHSLKTVSLLLLSCVCVRTLHSFCFSLGFFVSTTSADRWEKKCESKPERRKRNDETNTSSTNQQERQTTAPII